MSNRRSRHTAISGHRVTGVQPSASMAASITASAMAATVTKVVTGIMAGSPTIAPSTISGALITNVYNKTVTNNTTINRISYNGGAGGVAARPTAAGEAYVHARHVPPTREQSDHVQAARADRTLLASGNRGRPPVEAGAVSASGDLPSLSPDALRRQLRGRGTRARRRTTPRGSASATNPCGAPVASGTRHSLNLFCSRSPPPSAAGTVPQE
jgi:hypothetical protein